MDKGTKMPSLSVTPAGVTTVYFYISAMFQSSFRLESTSSQKSNKVNLPATGVSLQITPPPLPWLRLRRLASFCKRVNAGCKRKRGIFCAPHIFFAQVEQVEEVAPPVRRGPGRPRGSGKGAGRVRGNGGNKQKNPKRRGPGRPPLTNKYYKKEST